MTTPDRPSRIPPLSEPLEFARNTTTGRVHILCYGPERRWVPPTRQDTQLIAGALIDTITVPCRMLCGARLLVGSRDSDPAVWMTGEAFADDELCASCVTALGGQSWRAFHADNRTGDG